MAEQKTNAMRILDQLKIPYGTIYYEVEGEFTSGNDVAKKTGVPEDQDFKTLIAQGKSERYSVFVLPVSHEMDMKKAAKAVGEKSVDLIPVKDINRITGYVRGGCSPLGIKRQCRIVIHESAKDYDTIYVSGGKLGCTIYLNPYDLAKAAKAEFADIVLGSQ
ncbi:MAG: Cys-tRNA(Pro) deacylase [Candidatus Methanomethylophilaceae archaeon]|nr:Cys-tRNA(Pro) deacylase [Candidatus Methanomethylophilaceae archaeon]